MRKLLKELCLTDGISGDEKAVRELIADKIKGFCDYRTDNLGNLICFKKGRKTPEKKLMICAHMDEVGLIVTAVQTDGTLLFGAVGGIDPSVLIGRQVRVGEKKLCGVIGSTAVHNLSKEQREKAPEIGCLYIDIGAENREDAEIYVSPGDRAGCAMMIDMIRSELEYDTFFVFNVQEEIGLRGSRVSAFSVAPDFAIVLEATTAADIDGVSGAKRVCSLGNGPVVSFMDRSTVYDKELYNLAFDIAAENNIPCQTKTMIAGGNDAGAIHISRGGVRTIAVSVPCRYLHSPSCVIQWSDLENSLSLVKKLSQRICEL